MRAGRLRAGRIPSVPRPVRNARLPARAQNPSDGLCASGSRPGCGGRDAQADRRRARSLGLSIAWLLDQDGVIAIPKAQRPESQQSNLDALNIRLDDEDRAAIATLPRDQRYVAPPFAPDWNALTL